MLFKSSRLKGYAKIFIVDELFRWYSQLLSWNLVFATFSLLGYFLNRLFRYHENKLDNEQYLSRNKHKMQNYTFTLETKF